MERNEQQTKQHHEIEDGFSRPVPGPPYTYQKNPENQKKKDSFSFLNFTVFFFEKQPKASVTGEFRISSMAPKLSVRFS